MRSVFICTALVICVSSEQPFVRFSENLNKVVPDHYKYDKENPHRSVDKVARGHKVEPRQPPLKPQPAVPWFKWVHEGRWAAQADRNSELHKVRARLLEQKLKPNQFAFRPHINPQIKPKLKPVGGNRVKRETESIEVKKEPDVKIRRKRDATISQVQPEIMKPQQEAAMLQHTDQLGRIVKDSEKRDKRHILYFINRPPQLMARIPRTTPNPFIRDTHIEEYDIIRPEVGEREGMIPTIETGSSDPGSYPLVTFKNILTDLTKKLYNLSNLIGGGDNSFPSTTMEKREKRSPKMSKLKQRQKVEKKKRKKKKKKELSPRQIKRIRRKKEKKERRKRLHDKKLKEKRRLRHKKLGTGPYNKTITDYYGIYYEPQSSQLNESLYDSIYDTSEVDSDAIYEERMKERYDDYSESESVDSDAYYDEQIYGDTKESDEENGNDGVSRDESKKTTEGNQDNKNKKGSVKPLESTTHSSRLSENNETQSKKETTKGKKKE